MITKRRKGNKAQAKIPARNNIITTNIQIFSSRKLSHCYDRQPLQYELMLIIETFFSLKKLYKKNFFLHKKFSLG
jgi:hypothetical protein